MTSRIERRYLVQGVSRQVSAQIEKDSLYFELDGKAMTFTIVPGPPGTYVLTEGDRIHTGYAVAADGTIWVQLDGCTYVIEKEKPARPRAGSGPAGGGDVISPMTGTVRKIFVEAGESVPAGAPLLVVEAMKMEFTVTAPAEGRVLKLLCETGQSVDLGQILVQFESVSGADT